VGAWLLSLAILAGCGDHSASPPFEAVADMKQFMSGVLEPAAETYWDAVGTIMDQKGTTEIAPATDEEWAGVWRAALVIAESGNLLMLNGRARDRGEWIVHSRALIDAGKKAVQAAESRNPEAVFETGGEVYEACTGCHARYAAETLRPSDGRQEK
jgi:hypothetical protein